MKEVIFPIKFVLYNWSENLTHEQLTSTASAISMYLTDETVRESLTKKTKTDVERWLKHNDINQFIKAIHKMNAATEEVRMLNSMGIFNRLTQREH